ncbi:hypothetical protein [uncultured Cohaesibacter sp.]|uniref:hypothetical protein n=1 Tax=uncultured Cohaesibacter sp. TaxID=1002546 RepID=UPI0029C90F97|nr:hypothetical protein [uncultured Cohaesibacter sp.]
MPITHLVPPSRRQVSGVRGIIQNPLIRLLAINWLIGLLATVLIVAGLLVTNAAGLQELIFNSENPLVPLALLFFGLLITICSVAMGAAVMSLPKDDG